MDSTSAPAVSVVIAAYNAASTVRRAVASAQAQTIAGIEIVVVDDASTDATRDIVRDIARADPRVRLVEITRNGGPGAARNAGIQAARGRWIAVLDADDAYDRERLHRLLELGETTGADMVADNLRFVGGDEDQGLLLESVGGVLAVGAIQFVQSSMGARGQGRVSLGFLKPMVAASFLARHRIAYPSIRMSEDYFFALDCLVAGATWVVSRTPTYHYTVTGSSLTATFQPADLREVARLDLELARQPATTAHPGLARQVRKHGLAAYDAAVWTGLVDAARARDARAAWDTAWASKRVGRVLARRGPTAAGRLVGRRLRRTHPLTTTTAT